ncbi:MAG: flagellar brake protein [Gammaproteobacteria bacterium]|nr:MAG: flagellar brake protein [Gammaproteobacteria bacterium]
MKYEPGHFTYLQLGMPVLIDLEGMQHLQTALIGGKPGHYLILEMPKAEALGRTLERVLFKKGNQLVARYLHEGMAVGFKAQVVGIIEEPDRLVFISCPQVVTQRSLRKEPRVHCFLPARLQVGDQAVEGVTKDISLGGCRFTTPEVKMAQVLSDHVGKPVTIALNLPGVEGKVEVQGEQRSFMNDGQSLAIGIRFIDMQEEAREHLARCIDHLMRVSGAGNE